MPEFEKQILVAGVGNAWLQDDAFGGECWRRRASRPA
jgi:Ni,Fe-hydrogenase maturation factor